MSSPSVRLPDRDWPRIDERGDGGFAVAVRCDRCAGRVADCLICGNRIRSPQLPLLLDDDFDGA